MEQETMVIPFIIEQRNEAMNALAVSRAVILQLQRELKEAKDEVARLGIDVDVVTTSEAVEG